MDRSFFFSIFFRRPPQLLPHERRIFVNTHSSADGKVENVKEMTKDVHAAKKQKNWFAKWVRVFVHWVALASCAPHFVKWLVFHFANVSYFRICLTFGNVERETTELYVCMQTNTMVRRRRRPKTQPPPLLFSHICGRRVVLVLVEHNLEGFLLDLVTYVNLFGFVSFIAASTTIPIRCYSLKKAWIFLQFGGGTGSVDGRNGSNRSKMVCVCFTLFCLCRYTLFVSQLACRCTFRSKQHRTSSRTHYMLMHTLASARVISVLSPTRAHYECTERLSYHAKHPLHTHTQHIQPQRVKENTKN